MDIANPVDDPGKVWDLDLVVGPPHDSVRGDRAQQVARPNGPLARCRHWQRARLGVELVKAMAGKIRRSPAQQRCRMGMLQDDLLGTVGRPEGSADSDGVRSSGHPAGVPDVPW